MKRAKYFIVFYEQFVDKNNFNIKISKEFTYTNFKDLILSGIIFNKGCKINKISLFFG